MLASPVMSVARELINVNKTPTPKGLDSAESKPIVAGPLSHGLAKQGFYFV